MMPTESERFVPKVHPATRPVEPEDPMTLQATPVPGNPDDMLECLVQEYAWMGWNAEQILNLFRDPFYPALYAFYEACGLERLRASVTAILGRTGVLRFSGEVNDEPPVEEHEPELVEIGLPASWRSGRQS